MKDSRLIIVAVSLGLVGCASSTALRDAEYKLYQTETELAQLRRGLEDEQAKAAALTEYLGARTRQWETTRAEHNALRERTSRLEKSNIELQKLIASPAEQELTAPDVGASPLPAELDAKLRGFAQQNAPRVSYQRGRAAISFANDRLFDAGSDTVRPEARSALNLLAGIAAGVPAEQYEIIVVGHTDDTPIRQETTRAHHPSNWHLSVHRAIAVKEVLVAAGLPASRLGVMGYGQYRPLGADKARNRRIEIFFVRKGEVQSFAPVRPTGKQDG
jgi:chemotaxis protein MotB